jgi:hypothetical protein
MKKQKQGLVIEEIQQDPNKVIISNPLAVLKFNKQSGRGFAPVSIQEIGVFVPKIVWETISLLSNTDFENIKGDSITKRIYIRDFIKRIRGDEKNYKYVIDAARILRFWEISSVNNKGQEVYRGFFNDVTHDKKSGYIDFSISTEWASELLDIAKNGNVSFLKQYLFDLQNSHAINLYPTLKAHVYKGKYVEELEPFKIRFGYNTSGYRFFNNLKARVIEPAIEELNKKSDLMVYFEPEGTNLDGNKPRITGVIFWVKEKPKDNQTDTPQNKTSHASDLVKDVPFVDVLPQPLSVTIPKNTPSIEMIQELGEKASFTPEQIAEILDYFDDDYVKTWEALKGYSALKAQNHPIERPLAYILKSKGLGLGLWESQQKKVKATQDKQKVELIKKIQDDYVRHRDSQLEQIYNSASEEQKETALLIIREAKQNIVNGRNLAIDQKTKQLNRFGILQAGEMFAEAQKKGAEYRQTKYTSYILKHHNIKINFNTNDEVVI